VQVSGWTRSARPIVHLSAMIHLLFGLSLSRHGQPSVRGCADRQNQAPPTTGAYFTHSGRACAIESQTFFPRNDFWRTITPRVSARAYQAAKQAPSPEKSQICRSLAQGLKGLLTVEGVRRWRMPRFSESSFPKLDRRQLKRGRTKQTRKKALSGCVNPLVFGNRQERGHGGRHGPIFNRTLRVVPPI
jgi:hypothetical protein